MSFYTPQTPSVFDVAAYILSKLGNMTTMKMQKLLFYVQANALVRNNVPLFQENFEAWANGPVCPAYFFEHQGNFQVRSEPKGNKNNLTFAQKQIIDSTIFRYRKFSGQELSHKTHREDPWLDARAGTEEGGYCRNIITKNAIQEYYTQVGD